MIADLFIKILNLSIGAVPIMAALLVLRLLFKKAVPRKVFYIAWALVFLRLMVPFSLESDFSFFNFMPRAEVVEENIGTSVVFVENENERVEFPVFINPENENPNVDWVHHSVITGEIVTGPDITTVPMDKNMILGTVWIFGTAGLFLFGIIGYFAVLKKTKFESVPYTENIRLSDFFKTPIVCGLIRPKIILPMNFDLDDDAKVKSVIAHECTHIRRGDNFWRLLASFTLYVHWFNPLVWICYDAFIRDMEVSCDEEVLGKSESDIRGEYAESLVSLSGSGTNPLYGGVLSFGESAIKERVKCIMNFKKATVFILIICVMAAVALGVIFLTNPSAIGEENQSVSYEVFETENSKAVYSKENGLEIEVSIKNTDNKTIWLGPATYIYSAVEGNKNQFIGVYGNGGVLMIPKGEEALFCDSIPAERFYESVRYNLPAGEYILEREVYFDEELTPTGLYADFSFEIKYVESEAIFSNDFSGKIVSGSTAKDYIPNDFPEEEVLGDANMAEYFRILLKSICSGTTKLKSGGITFVMQPSDENIVKAMDADGAGLLMKFVEEINIINVEPLPNPSTGGLIEIYFETEGEIYKIAYDGRLVLSQRSGEYAYVFDGELIKDVFYNIRNHGTNLLLGDENNPSLGLGYGKEEPEEANPQQGSNENTYENEVISGAKPIATDDYYQIQANLYRNSDKTYIPSIQTERIVGFFEIYNGIEAEDKSVLGNPIEGVDVLELSRERDGKKYTLELYEKGFVLSGSAVADEYNRKAWICERGAWNNLIADINDEYSDANELYPYWFGIINIKNVSVALIDDVRRNGDTEKSAAHNDFASEDDCMSEFITRLREIPIVSTEKTNNAKREELLGKEDKYVYALLIFENGTEYKIYFTDEDILVSSSGMTYGLRYTPKEGINPYDLFLDFSEEGGPANPMTGKPVIYLYPEKETEVSVNLDFDGKLTYTYPALGSGWRVLAKPDGTLTNLADGSTHYYLFWEGTARPKWTYEKGFVVKGSETESFLRENLAKMGLTPREYNDFITYWVPKMQENSYNLISFSGEEYSEIAKLTVNPKPDSVIRIHMMWKALDEPIEIEPQVLPVYKREGFTLVEWGGTEIY